MVQLVLASMRIVACCAIKADLLAVQLSSIFFLFLDGTVCSGANIRKVSTFTTTHQHLATNSQLTKGANKIFARTLRLLNEKCMCLAASKRRE